MRTYVATPDSAHEASLAYLLFLHRSPLRWATYVFFLPLYALVLIGLADLAGVELTTSLTLAICLPATGAAVIGMNAWAYWSIHRVTRASFAAGSTYESAWDDGGIRFRGPAGVEGYLPYSLVRSTATMRDWVFLELANSSMVCIYPCELLPTDLEQRQSVAASQDLDERPRVTR